NDRYSHGRFTDIRLSGRRSRCAKHLNSGLLTGSGEDIMRYYGIKRRINLLLFNLCNPRKEKFECPICGYCGPFLDKVTVNGIRKHARCPNCSALERHRLQYLVLQEVFSGKETAHWRMLHVAPEAFFREFFSQRFGQYETADLKMKGADHI